MPEKELENETLPPEASDDRRAAGVNFASGRQVNQRTMSLLTKGAGRSEVRSKIVSAIGQIELRFAAVLCLF